MSLKITGTTVPAACAEITAYLQNLSLLQMSQSYQAPDSEDRNIAKKLSAVYHDLALEVQSAATAPPAAPGSEVVATTHELAQGAGAENEADRAEPQPA